MHGTFAPSVPCKACQQRLRNTARLCQLLPMLGTRPERRAMALFVTVRPPQACARAYPCLRDAVAKRGAQHELSRS